MNEFIIIGAGAIGRGYLPWILSTDKDGSSLLASTKFTFVETSPKIVQEMKKNRKFIIYRVRNKKLEEMVVPVANAYLPEEFKSEEHKNAKAVFINVGPRNVVPAAKLVENLECPIILSENDPATVDIVKSSTSLKKVYFAVPDVITSNSASQELLERDPLSVISEDGVMFIDEKAGNIPGEYTACSEAELKKQWTAKLFLHNTPHCIAAYLGALARVTYVHEAVANPEIERIVSGSMQEMLISLKLKWEIPHDFLDWYAEKELARFSNELLYDPISRVAREPLRKLESKGRLLGAAQVCLSLGLIPENILTGIVSALLFEDPKDSDNHLVFMRKALSTSTLLSHVLGLRKGEALERVLLERFSQILAKLERIRVTASAQPSQRTLPASSTQNLTGKSPISGSPKIWTKESELALNAVSTADEIILNRPEKLSVTSKESPRDVVSGMDRQIEAHLISALRGTGHPIVAEESHSAEQTPLLDQSGNQPLWIVDSIDGTANFVYQSPYFGISVGLLHQNEFVAGAVSLPAFKELYFTYAPEDGSSAIRTYLNGKALKLQDVPFEEALVGVGFSGTKGDPEFRKLQYEIFGQINDSTRGCLRTGSASANLCALASGKLHLVYGFNNQIWDIAGGLAIAKNAGAQIFWRRLPNSTRCHYMAGTPSAMKKAEELFTQNKWMDFK